MIKYGKQGQSENVLKELHQSVAGYLKEQKELQQQAEGLLCNKISRLQEIIDNIQEAVIIVDREMVIEYTSPSCQEMTGRSELVTSGLSVLKYVHPGDLEQVKKSIKKAVRSRSRKRMECRYQHAEGHYLWLKATCSAQYEEDGRLRGIIFTAQDISERKYTDQVLKESQKR